MNIAIHVITNKVIRLNICYLFGDNLLLNFKNKRKNRSTNKSNDNVFFKEKLTIMGINLWFKTLDPSILIDFNLDLILPSFYIAATHLISRRLKLKKIRPNINKKASNSSSL